jgi:uncharacterized membrane protein
MNRSRRASGLGLAGRAGHDPSVWLFVVVGGLFIALAIPLILRKVPPNSLYGLRIPETLEDDRVWFEANARLGRETLGSGIAIVIASSVAVFALADDGELPMLVASGLLVGVVIFLMIRGFQIARTVKRDFESLERPG